MTASNVCLFRVTTVRNPISLARAVLEKSAHVMLAGKGAEQFAQEQKLELVDNSFFDTEARLAMLERIQNVSNKTELDHGNSAPQSKIVTGFASHTIGACALAAAIAAPNVAAGGGNACTAPLAAASTRYNSLVRFPRSFVELWFSVGRELIDSDLKDRRALLSLSTFTASLASTASCSKFGTVGAVCVDAQGNVAAGTSTGGACPCSTRKIAAQR
ncbi:MAG: hypothetical protein BGO85_08325 [Enterobacter sp. 56-7]|nr:MAG: hypothetical protein BGO85_08325 [Enterobacter sp. 56-7]